MNLIDNDDHNDSNIGICLRGDFFNVVRLNKEISSICNNKKFDKILNLNKLNI